MPGAATGVAWPSMADDLSRSRGELGLLVVVHVVGYFVASIANGEITRRIGTGTALVISGIVASAALFGYAITPDWPLLLAAGTLLGVAGGLIDAGVNAHLALHHSARAMGLLHASFGVGATLGPFVMTWLIAAGAPGWRWGFALLGVIQLGVTVAFWRTRHRWAVPEASPGPRHASLEGTAFLLVSFALAAGTEGAAGAWAFTYLTDARAVPDGTAGFLVTAFFACFTLGRFAMGAVGDRIAPLHLLRLGMASTVIGLVLFWLGPADWMSGVGLLLAGLGLAPLFPVLVLITPALVGAHRAHDVVGYELGAATLGMGVIPAAIAIVVETIGISAAPAVLLAAGATFTLVAPRRTRAPASAN